MTDHETTSILLLESDVPLAGTLDVWVRTHVAEPLTVPSVHTLPDALAYLHAHRVDLLLADETAARNGLRAIHTAAPATAVIGLVMQPDESVLLHMLRQGAHEALSLHPSAETDHARMIERALVRVNGRAGILKSVEPRLGPTTAPPRLIHDLNNLLTSINGFADLLLNQLAPDHPARM